MKIIIIIAAIWFASAVARALYYNAKERKRQEEAQRRAAEIERIRYEWHEERKRNAERTAAMIALQKEQMRQAKEQERQRKEAEKKAKEDAARWEKQRKEDERRDALLAKHEEEIRVLKQTVKRLSVKVEDLDLRIINLESIKEIAEKQFLEADHAGDDTRKEKALRKLTSLDNQISAARDSRQAILDKIENANRKIAA